MGAQYDHTISGAHYDACALTDYGASGGGPDRCATESALSNQIAEYSDRIGIKINIGSADYPAAAILTRGVSATFRLSLISCSSVSWIIAVRRMPRCRWPTI